MSMVIVTIAGASAILFVGYCVPLVALSFYCLMIKRIKFIGIPVLNQDRALAFYTEKLGFKVFTDQAFNEKQRWIELTIPGAATSVVLFTPEGQEDRVGTFLNSSWEVDDVVKTFQDLSSKGVEFAGPPQDQPWGTFVIMKDSERNLICLAGK